eukprot:c41351_g1_i1.p3 GENE.c41351_g1_i1~~c41351_g1_i1.p3  ORF type:complete len:121 (+),score=20.91 c41351_g1_i1:254-616(+)
MQESGSVEEIIEFVDTNFPGRAYPIMGKVKVTGGSAAPLFRWLKAKSGAKVKWNFTTFVYDPKANTARRFGSGTYPSQIREYIEELLDGGSGSPDEIVGSSSSAGEEGAASANGGSSSSN